MVIKRHTQHILFRVIWHRRYERRPLSERGNPCRHIGYSFRLAARVLLYAPYRQDSTYHNLCFTSSGALVGTRNGSNMRDRSDDPSHYERTLYYGATSRSVCVFVCVFLPPPKKKWNFIHLHCQICKVFYLWGMVI